ncbi:septum formation initiator family protein [Embleya sp. NBC_00896]|uniref:FtsB family cell division protein n=1 Tax=Embleya sp. NBC_00896 TaxID=2975961 RepID=UPI00386B2EC8|nr:septum formation initiator family protein [Embleya sp. NBC_00896]
MSEQRESGRRTAAPTRAARASRAVAPPRQARGARPTSQAMPKVAAAVESIKDSPAAASLGRLRRRGGGKWIVLTLVVLSLAVALVYPLRQYLAQRDEVEDLRENTRKQQAEAERMRADLDRWNDPAYVRQQARERLHFVFPGDTAYLVVPPSGAAGSPAPPAPAQAGSPSWYRNLWDSTRDADKAPSPTASVAPTPTSTPATSIG